MYSFNNYLLLSFSSSLAPSHLTFPLGDLRHSVDPNEVHSKLCPTSGFYRNVHVFDLFVPAPFSITVETRNKCKLHSTQTSNCRHICSSLKTLQIFPQAFIKQLYTQGSDPCWEHFGNKAHTCAITEMLSKVQECALFCLFFQRVLERLRKKRLQLFLYKIFIILTMFSNEA